jgi:predicted ATP-grasp superfamily ATP-dependent carboligase
MLWRHREEGIDVTCAGRRLRVLLTEGSSLSARQAVYALGRCGYHIEVCDPQPLLCQARYSRYVQVCHRCPSFTANPLGYVLFLRQRLREGAFDVLLPVHDQAFLLARFRDPLQELTGLALPEFPAMERLQSKAEFVRLLVEMDLPHPATVLVRDRPLLERACRYPCYIKLSYSTAGCGVWHIAGPEQLRPVADLLEKMGLLDGGHDVLVQQPAPGTLGVVQCVFQQGKMVGGHCYLARAIGVGGSAQARQSVHHPLVLDHLTRLGAHLGWHGALTLDYLTDPDGRCPAYVDANPRLGEIFNATLSGVNLADLLVQVSLGETVPAAQPGIAGIRTHSLLMTLLAAAQEGQSRGKLLAELIRAISGRGQYAGSQDEITRPEEDPLSLLPGAVVAGRLLFNPRAARRIVRQTVENYALTEAAVDMIRQMAADPGLFHV